jgi:hypothetical protein
MVDFAKLCGFPALRIPDVASAVGEPGANAVIATQTLRGGQMWDTNLAAETNAVGNLAF